VYSNGTATTINVPKSTDTWVTGVSASGEVAGYYRKGSETFGFVESGGTYDTIDFPGSTSTIVEGINGSGDLVGYYSTATTTEGFIATPQTESVMMTPLAAVAAPEPSTWALMLTGLAGLGLAGYRSARNGRKAACA
jgi:hypothetical protein